MAAVLDGLRVVEFAQNIAVPYCGRMLATMGADVVKVEPPEGDAMRHIDPLPGHQEARPFSTINPGKRSIVVDLGHPGARPVVEALIRWADVVLTGMKGPDLGRYGIDYERVAALNPGAVYLQMSAFGPQGPDADQGGYDILASAASGLAFLSARDDGNAPEPVRPAYADHATGMCSTIAVLAALRHRDQTGQGQRVISSLLGSALALQLPTVARFDAVDPPHEAEFGRQLGEMRRQRASPRAQRLAYDNYYRRGAGLTELYHRNYQTGDGLIAVGAVSTGLRTRFHDATGLPDPRVEGWKHGSVEWTALVTRADALFASATAQQWLARLRAAKVPCVLHKLPYEALDDPQIRQNDMVIELDHPGFGRYTTANAPFVLERTPARVSGPSPQLGADTAVVLAQIGLSAQQIAGLKDSGAVR